VKKDRTRKTKKRKGSPRGSSFDDQFFSALVGLAVGAIGFHLKRSIDASNAAES